jgi:casein kinase 1 alpha
MELATTPTPTTKSEFIVGGRYRLIKRIGCGSFGEIYNGTDIQDGNKVIRTNKV